MPTSEETPKITARRTLEEYEQTKMDHTRLSLEKLTASTEYKKFVQEKKERRAAAVSTSMIVEDCNKESLAEDAKQSRHNRTVMIDADDKYGLNTSATNPQGLLERASAKTPGNEGHQIITKNITSTGDKKTSIEVEWRAISCKPLYVLYIFNYRLMSSLVCLM